MWTPFAQPWKGEPEFEGVPEALCRRALRDAVEARPHLVAAGSLVGLLVGGLVAVVIAWRARQWWNSFPLDQQGQYEVLFSAIMFLMGLGLASVGVAVGRDIAKGRALRAMLDRCRCPSCRYQFMGIPVWHNGMGVPQPGTASIRCPECGFQGNLLEMGLTPNELIPFQQRVVPPNVGDFHRRYRGTASAR